MITTPFQMSESGSYITITDPTTNEQHIGYILSLPSASAGAKTIWGFKPGRYGGSFRHRDSAVWSNYLQKFLWCGQSEGWYSSSMILSSDGINWENTTPPGDIITYLPVGSGGLLHIGGLVCSDELERCVAIRESASMQQIIYSDNGYSWMTSSFSASTLAATSTIRDISWSPTTNTFVGIGRPGGNYGSTTTTVTSSNGIDWKITDVSSVLTSSFVFTNIAWSSTHNKFVTYGVGYSDGNNFTSGSVATSTDGVSWTLLNSHSIVGGRVFALKEVNNIMFGIGYGGLTVSAVSASMRTSTDLENWSMRNTGHSEVTDIIYRSDIGKYIIAGAITTYNGDTYVGYQGTVISTSSNLDNWYLNTSFVDAGSVYSNYVFGLAWSPHLTRSILITRELGYWGVGENSYLAYHEDYNANIGFTTIPPNTLLNTSLSPWTSSFQYTNIRTDYLSFENNVSFQSATNVYTTLDIELALNASGDSLTYIPTSSYGIIIDSSSIALNEFEVIYQEPNTEDVTIDGIRYIREIGQSPGEEYETYQYISYQTITPTDITRTATSSLSISLKADGRDYIKLWYGAYGTSTYPPTANSLYSYVVMILNLQNGAVEYWEDSRNYQDEGSYGITTADNNITFIDIPTLESKSDGYWQLSFKVGFYRPTTRSGSLVIT